MTDMCQPLDWGLFKPVKMYFLTLRRDCIRDAASMSAPKMFLKSVTTAEVRANAGCVFRVIFMVLDPGSIRSREKFAQSAVPAPQCHKYRMKI